MWFVEIRCVLHSKWVDKRQQGSNDEGIVLTLYDEYKLEKLKLRYGLLTRERGNSM